MCGIFGYIGMISKELALTCTNSLSHRGPDGFGLQQFDRCTFGHRRLAILDLSDQGRQPMSYADDRYWITYNGEIYNFIELRHDLEKYGHRFRSDSDTEVILVAFLQWGEQCVEKFNGMWAFGIWDNSEKRLFLSRDRFGKKPLFYTQLRTGFAFASEMKALYPLLDDLQPNTELLKNPNKIFIYEATDECVIHGIKRFPAGHSGWLKNGQLILNRYWCTLENLVDVPKTYEEQAEQFRELFFDACRLRMRSDVPIGTALSGGLDSSVTISTVSNIASKQMEDRLNPEWQHAFVASFPGTPLDETQYAKMVTDNLDIQATIINVNPLNAIDKLDEYFFLFEDFYITSPLPFMLTYRKIKENGINVSIDGHGADECFGGYQFDIIHALADVKLNINCIKMILNTIYKSYPAGSIQFKKLSPKFIYWLKYHLNRKVKSLTRCRYSHKIDSHKQEYQHLDYFSQQLYQSTHATILPTILRNYDRYSMANGVEIRMPFMDHRIVSFAFSLPWSSKIRNGYSKAIIRDALADLIPQEIAYRKVKVGFNSPIVDWMKGPLKHFFLDTINSHAFQTCELIDPIKVAKSIQDVIYNNHATFSDGEKAWTLLTPFLWHKALLSKYNKRYSEIEGSLRQ